MFFKNSKKLQLDTMPKLENIAQTTEAILKEENEFSAHYKHGAYFDTSYDIMWANYRMLTELMMDNYKKQMLELGLFDDKFYKESYPEYKKYNLSSIDHYINIGWQMFYNPSKEFNTRRYIRRHHSLQICPLVHFLQMGRYYASYAYYNDEHKCLDCKGKTLSKTHKKRCVYTCLVGNYDSIREPHYIQKGWDYICFTDNANLLNMKNNGVWTFKSLKRNDLDPVRANRYHKILPHIVLPEYEESLYIDSNIEIISPFIFDLIESRGSVGLLLPYHFMDKDVYNHADWIIKAGKDAPEPIEEFINIMKTNNFPRDFGMTENNIIFRTHSNEMIQRIMEEWWTCIVKYCKRDQLSLMYLLWKNGIPLYDFCFANARSNINHFKLTCHK